MDDASVSRALWQAHHVVEQALDDALAPLGMSTSLVGTMGFIAEHPGLSAADLARLARVKPQSVAHVIGRLAELDLITRSPHPVHGRVIRLHLTDLGWRTLDRAAAVAAEIEGQLTAGLSDDTRRHLLITLDHLRETAEQLRAQ